MPKAIKPWVHGQDYVKQNKAQIKHLLQLRNLPYSGNKAKMVSRLVAHDSNHPFPFEKLPSELRNEIYILASTSQVSFVCQELDRPLTGHTECYACCKSLKTIMRDSSLFRVSKQTRAEGLALFYRHHHFLLLATNSDCLRAILGWLKHIGDKHRTLIRHLQINWTHRCAISDMEFMSEIRGKLSDEATLVYSVDNVYCADNVRNLWRIGQLSAHNHPFTASSFRIFGVDHRDGSVIHETFSYNGVIPAWQFYARYGWTQGWLTF